MSPETEPYQPKRRAARAKATKQRAAKNRTTAKSKLARLRQIKSRQVRLKEVENADTEPQDQESASMDTEPSGGASETAKPGLTPSASEHTAPRQGSPIEDEPKYITSTDVHGYVSTRLVVDERTSCSCGWYIFCSAVCGHPCRIHRSTCGRRTTGSGVNGFCKSPAKRNFMKAKMTRACCDCMPPGSKGRRPARVKRSSGWWARIRRNHP